jgi:outer membrane receptor protein involved in Fe transport
LCYNSTALSSPFCNQTPGGPIGFVRDVNGALVEVNTALANVNEFETSGWDFQLNYAFDVNSLLSLGTDLGRLNLNAQWTHLNSYTFTALAGTIFESSTTSVGAIGAAEDQAVFSAIWNVGDLRLTWSGQYLSEANDFAPEIIPSQWFHDMSARYQIMDNLAIYGGVRNIGDNYVFIGQGVGGQVPTGWTTAPDTYDGLGRRYFVGARVEF